MIIREDKRLRVNFDPAEELGISGYESEAVHDFHDESCPDNCPDVCEVARHVECESAASAWAQALDIIAEEAGLTNCETTDDPADETSTPHPGATDGRVELVLWQWAIDSVSFDEQVQEYRVDEALARERGRAFCDQFLDTSSNESPRTYKIEWEHLQGYSTVDHVADEIIASLEAESIGKRYSSRPRAVREAANIQAEVIDWLRKSGEGVFLRGLPLIHPRIVESTPDCGDEDAEADTAGDGE